MMFTPPHRGALVAGRAVPVLLGPGLERNWHETLIPKKAAAIAKLTASNAAMDNARDATQIFGGYGVMNEFPVARFYRDAKILEMGEGT
jgi:alkylation response protein AidB-like acyl-CoA dehydrogenase